MRGAKGTAVALVLGAVLTGTPVRVFAQDAPLRLTLAEVVSKTDQNSHRLAGLRARVDAAVAAQAGRQAAERPAVALLGGYMRTNHVDEFSITVPGQPPRIIYPDLPDNYHARVDLRWPIYTGGRGAALARAAGAERDAAAFEVAAGRADLRLDAVRAFWALVTARQAEEVVARAVDSIEAHVRVLRVRLDQGLIPPNDVLSAEAQRSHQRVLAIEARNIRSIAEADLRRLIGEDSRRPIEPIAPPDPAPSAGGVEAAAIEQARTARPERQALASRVSAAREREAASAAARLPQLAVAAGYDYARPNPRIVPRLDAWRDSWDASVNVSWSLWDGGRRRAEQAEAAAGTRAALARALDFDRELAFEIEQRRLEADSAAAAISAADDGVRAAAEARRVVGERFAAGVASSTDVLDAQTALLQAELDRTRAAAAARLAEARLDRALGR